MTWPLQKYYGNTFVFPYDKGFLASHTLHPMGEVIKSLADQIMNQTIGTSPEDSKKTICCLNWLLVSSDYNHAISKLDALKEGINGTISTHIIDVFIQST